MSVEAELGILAGVEEEEVEKHEFTRPEEVESFVNQTGVDSLHCYRTSHGVSQI